jgi:pyruvate kinase
MASTDGTTASPIPKINTTLPAAALARGAWRIVHDLQTKLVVIFSQTGATARVFAKHHFPVPIISMSSDQRVLRRMAMLYGVIPQQEPKFDDLGNLIAAVDELLLERKFAERGDRIVVVAGWSPATPDTMNGLVMHTVGDPWSTTRKAKK